MPKRQFFYSLATLGLAAQFVNGQLEPDCNPLLADCPAKKAWPKENYYIDFTKETGPPENWIIANYEAVSFGPQGAEFTYGRRGDAPNMWTDFYILGGRYDVEMQIAPGQGVVSNAVLWSDVQDEIDWEFSGNQHGEKPFPPPDGKWTVETNIFAQGKMWDGAATYQKDVVNPTTQFHTYSVEWDDDHINWYVDNQVVRSVQASTTPSGLIFPQTPMKLQLGVWGGGDPANSYWTIQWAGGEVDMKGAPYTMYVRSVNITNKYPACQYKYTDKTAKITDIEKIQDGCGSSAATSVFPKIVDKSTQTIETSALVETIEADHLIGSYPVSPVSSVLSSSRSDSTVKSQSTSAVSSASTAASVSTSPADTGHYPVSPASSSVPTTPLPILSSYPVSPLSSSSQSTTSASSGGYPVASSSTSRHTTPVASASSYPVVSPSSTGGFLSSLSSLILGTSSKTSSSSTISSSGSSGTYPATPIITSSSALPRSSVALSNSSYPVSGAPGSSTVGSTTSVINHSVTGSSTVGNSSSSASIFPSSYPVPPKVSNTTSALTSAVQTESLSSSSHSAPGSLISSTSSSDIMPTTYTFSSEVITSFVSTVYSTNIVTITSCAPTVKDCVTGQVTTETVSLSTTICPITNTVIDGKTFSGKTDSTTLIGSSTLIPGSSYPVSSQSSTSQPTTSIVPSVGTSSPALVSSGIYQNTTVPFSGSTGIYQNTSSPAVGGTSTTVQTSTVQVSATPTQFTTSTVYSTNIYTVTSCAPTVVNCPAVLGQVTTELVSLYTTVCPVKQEGSTGAQETPTPPVSTSTSSVPAQYSTSLLSSSSTVSSPIVLTTSTVYTSSVYTISSCAPGATDCASSIGSITTELVPLYTTVCPVKDNPTTSSSHGSSAASHTASEQASSATTGASSALVTTITPTTEVPVYTTSTVYSTNVYTVTSCGPDVPNCPAIIGSVTTEIVAVSTTICPVSDKTVPAAVTSTEVTISNILSNSVIVITSVITFIDTPIPTAATSTAHTAGTTAVSSSNAAHATTQPCTTLTLGNYFTTVITYASLTKQPPASVSYGSVRTSYYTVSSTPEVDVPSYSMTETASTVEMGHPSNTIVTTTSVAATHSQEPGTPDSHVTTSMAYATYPVTPGQTGEDGQCICQPTTSTVYATVTVTVAETTKTVEPPFPSTYPAGTGGTPLGTGTRPVSTGGVVRRWFRRVQAGHGHGHGQH